MAFLDGIRGGRAAGKSRDKPFRPRSTDVCLACYPRSGSTWVRGVVAEAMFGTSGETMEDLDYYCPDIHARTPASRVRPAESHLVKSHWPRTPQHRADRYRKVVYLLRDPRDLVLSYYRYLSGLKRYRGGFDEFLTDWLCGRVYPCSWSEHVASWLGPAGAAADGSMLVLRYEDLSSAPTDEFARLLDFLGVQCRRQRLAEVLEHSSAESMRLKERRGMRPSLRVDGLEFVGPARAGRWREELTDRQLERIHATAGWAMKIAGYQ